MQMDEAAQLRRNWDRKDNPKCPHPQIVKEYHLGAQTGDVACTTCGATWWHTDPERPAR
jgi:hypothetical protein